MSALEDPGLGAGQMDEVRRTGRQLVAAALKVALADAEMGGVPTKAIAADRELALAARNHFRAWDAVAPMWQPKGWAPPAADTCPECGADLVAHQWHDGTRCACLDVDSPHVRNGCAMCGHAWVTGSQQQAAS